MNDDNGTGIVQHSYQLGRQLVNERTAKERKSKGQFLTSPAIARYMAHKLGELPEVVHLLDPGAGSATLACAVIERAIEEGWPRHLYIDAYEIDGELCATAREALGVAAEFATSRGIQVQAQVHEQDFILARTTLQPTLFSTDGVAWSPHYNAIIANPPYFKLRQDDPRVHAAAGLNGRTNIYTLFMALGVELLTEQGRACYIVPRSFCSGTYFARFRRDLIQKSAPIHVHLFESRDEAFGGDTVLQENIIFVFQKRGKGEGTPDTLTISVSNGTADIERESSCRTVSFQHFVRTVDGDFYFRLPVSELDEQIVQAVDSWEGSLETYGLKISTGPVVPFRAPLLLQDTEAVAKEEAVPLYWLHNVKPHCVIWPAPRGDKPQALATTTEAEPLLIPAANYVLMRRFSAKEEPRRLTVAPFLRDHYGYGQVGLENHLNYIFREGGELEPDEVRGLAALLGSALMDRYFRIANGNTQVNAAELRALPLPPWGVVKEIGHQVPDRATPAELLRVNRVVYDTLRSQGCLPGKLPIITETRMTMGKIQEAQDVLQTLGLPQKQQNEISALTLLVLAQLSEETPWKEAQRKSLRIHDMLDEMKERYDKEYAENTRESVRRQVIHQFEQAGVVARNPDDQTLAPNSPRTHYALSDAVLRTIWQYGSAHWVGAAQEFLETQVALIERYKREREVHRIPLKLPTGEEYTLSPGAHNKLQAQIINDFGQVFAPGARVLYVGDAENKMLHIDEDELQSLGFSITKHDKLPDVVLYDQERRWLYLIEAVTSHGPVTPKRFVELEEMFEGKDVKRVYVSAFPNFGMFKNHLTEIAWDTEVWLADAPDHMIHFNGSKFFSAHS